MRTNVASSTSFERILIIGGRSFFARHLFEEALKRYPSAEIVRSSRFENAEQGWVQLDTGDWSSVQRVVRRVRPDLVINSSGVTSGSFHHLLRTNAIASSMIAGAVGKVVPEARLILLGSASEYGVTPTPVAFSESDLLRGASLYGMSKRYHYSLMPSITKTVRQTIYLRLFNLVGNTMPPHLLFGKVLRIAEQRLARKDASPIEVGFLGDYRDFIDASIAASYTLSLAETEADSAVINVGTGEFSLVRDKLTTWLEQQSVDLSKIQLGEKVSRHRNFSFADIARLRSLVPVGHMKAT